MKQVTFNCNIYGNSGLILFNKGDTVDLWEENWKEGHWSNICLDLWIPKKLKSVSVFHDCIIGIYDPETFKEYKK